MQAEELKESVRLASGFLENPEVVLGTLGKGGVYYSYAANVQCGTFVFVHQVRKVQRKDGIVMGASPSATLIAKLERMIERL